MRIHVRLGSLSGSAALAAVVWACGGGGDGTEPPTTGTVTGQVTVDGSPRAGAVTRLRAVGAATDARPAQTTNATGNYTFTLVPPDEYRVLVDLADTLAADPGPAEDTVTVTADQTATAATFALRLLAGTVEGAVEDNAGTPLAGRSVLLQRAGSTVRTTTSDAVGSYNFSDVSVGEYTVRSSTVTCGEQSGSTPVSVSDGATSMADVTVTIGDCLLSQHVQPILQTNCALSGCHGTTKTPTIPDMEFTSASKTHETTVNVGSIQRPGVDRVEPGSPDQTLSYLVCKIEATCPTRTFDRMPQGGPFLSSAQIDTIKTWIAQGAQSN